MSDPNFLDLGLVVDQLVAEIEAESLTLQIRGGGELLEIIRQPDRHTAETYRNAIIRALEIIEGGFLV